MPLSALTNSLHRRNPTDLLPCYPGKEMVSFSLKIKDYPVTVERHRLEEAKLTTNWGRQRQRLADAAACQHIVAMTSETIDAICQHVEAVSLAGDEARVLGESYTPEEIKTIALQRRRFGYRRVHDLLRTAYPGVNQVNSPSGQLPSREYLQAAKGSPKCCRT